jgi:acetoin utilization deacetylase AcuC-like enzyme
VPVPVFTHPSCERHDPGAGHPEAPSRLRAVRERLAGEPTAALREAPAAPEADLLAVHQQRYLEQVLRLGDAALDRRQRSAGQVGDLLQRLVLDHLEHQRHAQIGWHVAHQAVDRAQLQ